MTVIENITLAPLLLQKDKTKQQIYKESPFSIVLNEETSMYEFNHIHFYNMRENFNCHDSLKFLLNIQSDEYYFLLEQLCFLQEYLKSLELS